MRHLIILFSVLVLALCLTSCLTVESKEYRIKLKPDHSGEATIKFTNILSEADDTVDISADDFNQLIEFYLQGTQLEKENPGFHNVKKRLFEEGGVLCGEITFTFDSLGSVRIFKYDGDSPYMYGVGSPLSSEQYIESNGLLAREWMPVVFWPKDARDLYIKTKVVSEVSFQQSLLKNYKTWLAQPPGQKQRKP
ncbi:MAG TPA: hypothetical protein DGH68_10850 [Bacteroidetes bacterium]|nr:hypothetical protein [Bacteroidota bacterium]